MGRRLSTRGSGGVGAGATSPQSMLGSSARIAGEGALEVWAWWTLAEPLPVHLPVTIRYHSYEYDLTM